MSYLIDTHALRPRHEAREQDFMCTSTLNNVFSKHVLEKKLEHLSSGDELWVPDVENYTTNGPMMSKIGSTPVLRALLRRMTMGPYFHEKRERNITCMLALPNGHLLCSDDQHVSHFENDATQIRDDFEQNEFHVIVELQKLYEETRIRTVSIAQKIKNSILLEPSRNPELPLIILNIAENPDVKIGDLIYKIRGQSVLGMSLAEVYVLIKQDSFVSLFELDISDPEVCVASPKIKSLFVYANNSVVFVNGNKLSLRNTWDDIIVPLAGHETAGYVNGKGEDARFNNPRGVIVNPNSGDVIVADSGNHAIRLIKSDGTVTTLAGAPPPDPARRAGDLTRQRAQTAEQRAWYATFASKLHSQPASDRGLAATAALDRAGLHESDGTPPPEPARQKCGSRGFCDETGLLARFNTPTYLAWDNHDRIVVVDAGNHSVRRVTMQGVVSTVAGGGVRVDLGHPGVSDGNGIEALFNNPGSVVVDADGTIVVADTNNNRLCKIVGDTVTTMAVKNGTGVADGDYAVLNDLCSPVEMTLQRDGKLMIQPRPGLVTWIIVDFNLKEPAWFKMYREGVRRRWCMACCVRLGRLMYEDQSFSALDTSQKIMDSILRMVVDEPSFLDERSKRSLLKTVQAFGARIQDQYVRRVFIPQPPLAAPGNNARGEHPPVKKGRVKQLPTPIPGTNPGRGDKDDGRGGV